MIEYIKFTDEVAKNRDELAKDVVGVKCTYVGHITRLDHKDLPMQDLWGYLRDYQYMSTVEMYANGRANIYVKEVGQPRAIGFLRYTLDECS